MMTHNAQGVEAKALGIFDKFNVALNEVGYCPGAGTLSGAARFTGALAVIIGESLHTAGLALASTIGPTKQLRGKCRAKVPVVAKNVVSAAHHLVRGGVEIGAGGPILYYRDRLLAKEEEVKVLSRNFGVATLRIDELNKQIKAAEEAISTSKAEKSADEQKLSVAQLGLEERTKELEQLRKELAVLTVEKGRLEDLLKGSKQVGKR